MTPFLGVVALLVAWFAGTWHRRMAPPRFGPGRTSGRGGGGGGSW